MCLGRETYWNAFLFDTIKNRSIARRHKNSYFTGAGDTVNKQAVQISW